MKIKISFIASFCCLVILFACSKSDKKDAAADPIAQGEEIYHAKKCAFCHENEEMLTKGEVKDLARPVIANDTMFVQTHLKFVNASTMPPVELTSQEIRFVSHYINHLHAQKNQTATAETADAKCPICGALVEKAEAIENGLSFTFEDSTYYFECAECLYVFQQAPAAYMMK
ncbi:hypothetical protein KC799_27425 [candidate division KSB1 bacterium]|nr:hypothetical protein [candidate division KSB1 bacterium]